MRSYPVLVGGEEQDGTGWVYTARASALLDDPLQVGRLILRLERGAQQPDGDGRVVGRVALATPEQHAEALRRARAAQPTWARVPLAHRFEFVTAIERELTARADELVDVLVAEGHPLRLARWEVSGVLAALHPATRTLAAELSCREMVVGGRTVRLVHKPDGVVCLSPPLNAAASNSAVGIWSLAAGNALVVGAPRSCPLGVSYLYQEIVAPILYEHGAPRGTLSVLCGVTGPMLRSWLASPEVDDIYYFGSAARGLRLAEDCAAAGKKAVLELAGNDGVLVWRDAEVELAAKALAECFFGSGQICMVPRYAIAHPDIAESLIAALLERVAGIRPGLPDNPEVLLSPVFRAPQLLAVVDEATAAGAELVTGGRIVNLAGAVDPGGMFIEPTVLRVAGLAAAEKLRAVREETFFPLMSIVVPEPTDDARQLEDAIAFLNANRYGLRNSLWARNPQVIERFCAEVHNAGLLKVNDSHIGFVPALPPHGGTGLSGGPFGEAAVLALRTSHRQGISLAGDVQPRSAVFDYD